MKKSIWTRLLLCLLLGALLISAVACKGDKDQDPTNTSDAEDETKEEIVYPFDIEDCGENGAKGRFHMAVRTDRSDFIDSESLDGTIINDAVYERNALVEELFNVEVTMFEAGGSDATQYNANITADIMGNVGAYDCTIGWDGSKLETQCYYMNLLSFPELDFANDEWWLDSWHENNTLGDCMFTCNGDLMFELYYNIAVIYYNKTIAENLIVEDENNLPINALVYQHVDNKTWTIDRLQKYGEIAATDVGEDGYHSRYDEGHTDSQDIFGSLFNVSLPNPMMFGFGAKYATVANGTISFDLTNIHNYDAFDKIFEVVNEIDWNYLDLSGSVHRPESYEIFNDGHALFCWNIFLNAPNIKGSGVSYGILPLPMYNVEQGKYATACFGHSYFAFLTSTRDCHKAALVFNAMNALSTDILYDKYFGEYLEFRVSDDPDSSRMIPLIYDSLYFDCAWTNPTLCGSAGNYFGLYVVDGNKSISTKMATFQRMDDYIKEIQKIYANVKAGNSR